MLQKADIIRLKSFDGDGWHTISLDQKKCDCQQFQTGGRCDHLSALGLHNLRPFVQTTHPTYSQALSGLVKSLRIRKVSEAVYWLLYLDTFREKQHRFRTARRLLIGSAEDGHSIPAMEKIASSFRLNCKPETDLLYLVADAVRICKLPNWWHPSTGGPDYIYQSMIGQRKWWHKQWDRKLTTLEHEIARAIDCQDRAMAIGGVMAYANLKKGEQVGATKQAEYLLRLAEERKNRRACRLCMVHLSQRSALSGDNNFLCQAAWMLAGGVSPIAESGATVTPRECYALIEAARESWKNPHPIPTWCTDGIHCAGNDTRFAGLLPEMNAVCRAFQFYGRVDPADDWLPEFMDYSGLIIKTDDQAGETA